VILTVEIVKNVDFCSLRLYSLIQTYGRFGETKQLHIKSRNYTVLSKYKVVIPNENFRYLI
jgi:hypothetical protein